MAVYKRDIIDINLETGNIYRSWLKHSIGYKDQKADHFGVRVFRDGEAVSLTGVSVQGVFMPPQGDPIAITSGNIVSGNVAEVVLPQACYNYDGQFTLAIKLVDSTNSVTGTVRIVDGMVDNTHASGTVAPTSAVPTYQEVLSVYEQAIVVIGKSVRFDTDQSLTDAQKTTARTNIAAASTGELSDLKSAMSGVQTGEMDGYRHVSVWVNGTWSGMTLNTNNKRIRPDTWVFVKAGDVISIVTGSYVHGVGLWKGDLDTHTSVRNDGSWVTTDETITVNDDGFFIVAFALASDTTAVVNPASFDGSITITSYAMRMKKETDGVTNELSSNFKMFNDDERYPNGWAYSVSPNFGAYNSTYGYFESSDLYLERGMVLWIKESNTVTVAKRVDNVNYTLKGYVFPNEIEACKIRVYTSNSTLDPTEYVRIFYMAYDYNDVRYGYVPNDLIYHYYHLSQGKIGGTGTRRNTPCMKIKKGDRITIDSSYQFRVIFNNAESATDWVQEYVAVRDCVVDILIANTNTSTNIMSVDFTGKLRIESNEVQILKETADRQIITGDNVQSLFGIVSDSGTISSRSDRITTDKIFVTKGTVVALTGNYMFKVTHHSSDGTITTDAGWNRYFKFIENDEYIRIILANINYSNFTGSDVKAYTKYIKISGIRCGEAVMWNTPAIQQISALRRVANEKTAPRLTHKTVAIHISDTHSDSKCWNNCVEISNHIRPDIVLHTGDLVKGTMNDDYTHLLYNLPLAKLGFAVGNHEAGYYGQSTVKKSEGAKTNEEIYNALIKPISDHYGYGATENYYYVDVNDVRFVFINCYDYDHMEDENVFTNRSFIISQDQYDWFINTLQDALVNDLSVVICAHEPDMDLTLGSGDESKFDQDESAVYSGTAHNKPNDYCPLCDVIEAFIKGQSINRSYEQRAGVTISVNTSFASEGKFVAWLAGHRHGDYCGFLPGYSQYCMVVTCGCSSLDSLNRGLEGSDLPRISGNVTEDAFNAIAIDTTAKTLSVVRFGANVNYLMEPRDYMVVSYVSGS